MSELMSLSVAGRENIKTVGSKNASKTFVGDHWEKYLGSLGRDGTQDAHWELGRKLGGNF